MAEEPRLFEQCAADGVFSRDTSEYSWFEAGLLVSFSLATQTKNKYGIERKQVRKNKHTAMPSHSSSVSQINGWKCNVFFS